jgi:hypothetical protein
MTSASKRTASAAPGLHIGRQRYGSDVIDLFGEGTARADANHVRPVEISAPAPAQLDQPWRTATLVASGVAALELVLLLIIGAALLSKPLSAHAKGAAVARATGIAKVSSRPEPKSAALSRRATSVLILNGNGIAGAAAAAASRIHARGYPVSGTGNAARGYGQSVVMYRPGRLPEGKRLAADLGISLVGPLDGIALRQLHRAQLVVVLGT